MVKIKAFIVLQKFPGNHHFFQNNSFQINWSLSLVNHFEFEAFIKFFD